MIILEPNQPWPQVYFRRYKYSSFPFGEWEEGYEDKSIIDLTLDAKSSFLVSFHQPKTLFAGPRANKKIQDLISLDSRLTIETDALYLGGDLYRRKEFLGLDLILTIDDGLWMA